MEKGDGKPFAEYHHSIEQTLSAGHATEGSHYPALKLLLESLCLGLSATSLPSRIECGAPDFVVTKGSATIGYMEAKDIGASLDGAEHSEQLRRYLKGLPNLVLTNYLDFRWYVNGERRSAGSLGVATKEGKVKRDKVGLEAVGRLLSDFLAHQAIGVGTPRELAQRMARLSHLIREGVIEAFEKQLASTLLHDIHRAFRDTLIPDLPVAQFADMYAQTLAYGLFAARCTQLTGKDFSRQNAAGLIPKTNPFLREIFYQIAGPKLDDEPYCWAVDEIVMLLARAGDAWRLLHPRASGVLHRALH